MKLKKNTNKKVQENKLTSIQIEEEKKLLLFKTEEKNIKLDVNKEIELYQLRNDKFISKDEAVNYINNYARKDVDPMFPNEKPFFKLIYKLCGWDDLDPNKFTKPPLVGKWIKQYIYGRFTPDILPNLLAKDNPVISGYIKQYKLYQFLNDEGLLKLEGFINDAIEVMNISKDWYDFEKKYTAIYSLPVQLKMNLKK